MIFLTPNQNHAGSGLINISFLENIYQTVIGETFTDLGRDVILHLSPIVEQDVSTQSKPQQSQVNPFFASRVPIPVTNTKHTGKKITTRDVIYKGQIVQGPIKEGDDNQGIGDLNANQVRVTLDGGALRHVNESENFSIEGRRYSVDETRIIGFSTARYIILHGTEINDIDTPSTESQVG